MLTLFSGPPAEDGVDYKSAADLFLDALLDLEIEPTVCQLEPGNGKIVYNVSKADKEKALKAFKKKASKFSVTPDPISKEPVIRFKTPAEGHEKLQFRLSALG